MKPTFVCTKCGQSLQWEERFCTQCGVKIEWPTSGTVEEGNSPAEMERCGKCGALNSPSDKRCESCGSPLPQKAKSETKPAPKGSRPSAAKKGKAGKESSSWKSMVLFIGIIVAGVVILELTTSGRPTPTQSGPVDDHEHDHSEMTSANMAVLPQIEEMEKKVAANPGDQQLLLNLANFLHDNRFYDKAIIQYRKYLERNPKDADARVDLGICYNDLSDFDEARSQMEQALKFNPKHLLGHFNLGIVNLRAGDVEKANEWFKKVIALDPNSGPAQRAKQLMQPHSTLTQ